MIINAVKFRHTPDIFVVNQAQFEEHYKLYEGYVNQINQISRQLDNVSDEILQNSNTTDGVFRGLKKGETYALNGVVLHELYFRNIGGKADEPDEIVRAFIELYYGTFTKWAEDFKATAKCSRGWTVLGYDQRTRRLRNFCYDLHDYGDTTFTVPLLVLDMYEHAYFMQYGTDKEAYIEAFIMNIHWGIVKQRLHLWKLIDEI